MRLGQLKVGHEHLVIAAVALRVSAQLIDATTGGNHWEEPLETAIIAPMN